MESPFDSNSARYVYAPQPVNCKRKRLTQKQKVLNNLMINGETRLEDYKTGFRLSARINELRNEGYKIKSVRIEPWNPYNLREKYIFVSGK